MNEQYSSIDTKVQQLIDEDLRRSLFQSAANAMFVNLDEDGFNKKDDLITAEGKNVLWKKPESATHTLKATELDNPWDLYDLGVEDVTVTYFPPRKSGGKEFAESVVIEMLPLGGNKTVGDSLAYKLQLYEPGLFEEVDIMKIQSHHDSKSPIVGEATHDDVEHLKKILEVMHHDDSSTLATP